MRASKSSETHSVNHTRPTADHIVVLSKVTHRFLKIIVAFLFKILCEFMHFIIAGIVLLQISPNTWLDKSVARL